MSSLRNGILLGAACVLTIVAVVYNGDNQEPMHWVHAEGLANTGEQVEFMAECNGNYATELTTDNESVKINKLCDDSLFAVTSDEPVKTTLTAKVHTDDGKVITGTYTIEFKDDAVH